MNYYVYTLTDESGDVVYVGETKNPKQRLYDHTRRKPAPGHGLFYGKHLQLELVGQFLTKKEAWWFQVKLQTLLGLETDYVKLRNGATFESCSKGGKRSKRCKAKTK